MKRTTLFMNKILRATMLVGLFSLTGIAGARAQLVQVGPGYVKAPFVRVERGPEGTRVRAPFTRVETGRPAYSPAYHRRHALAPQAGYESNPLGQADISSEHPLPGTKLAAVERQRRKLAILSRRLDRDLMRMTTAAHWQTFLQLPVEVVSPKRAVVVEPGLETLQRTLARFALVAENEEYQSVARIGSFRATYRELKVYLAMVESADATSETPEPSPPTDPAIKRLPSVLVPIEDPHFEALPPSGGLFQP